MEFWNAFTSPLSPALFFIFLLTDYLFRSPGVLLICYQQDIWIQCEQNVLLWASPMQVVLYYERSSVMFFLCAVSPEHSTVWSAYLVFIFLMIASITLLYQRLVFIAGQQEFGCWKEACSALFLPLYCECSPLHIQARDEWVSAVWSSIA